VRRLSLWNDPKINTVLRQTLDYLSDDYYDFSFYPAKDAPLLQGFFTGFDTGALPKQKPEQVMMFSGGLDSLAGAIEEIVVKKRMVTLVNGSGGARHGIAPASCQGSDGSIENLAGPESGWRHQSHPAAGLPAANLL
jgi:hypothetical protein